MERYIGVNATIKAIEKEQKQLETSNDVMWEINRKYWKGLTMARAIINEQTTADVVPTDDVFECVDRFRDELMSRFIDLCRGNDYNKLTLLKIDDVVCNIYDKQIAELKKKYAEENKI
jgi:hypothetical protein